MDFEIYLSLTGEKQGEVIGPVTYKGKEGLIAVSAWSTISLDQLLQGRTYATKSIHTPLTLWKGVDLTTPLLYKAFCELEKFKKFELQFWPLPGAPALTPRIKGKDKHAPPADKPAGVLLAPDRGVLHCHQPALRLAKRPGAAQRVGKDRYFLWAD